MTIIARGFCSEKDFVVSPSRGVTIAVDETQKEVSRIKILVGSELKITIYQKSERGGSIHILPRPFESSSYEGVARFDDEVLFKVRFEEFILQRDGDRFSLAIRTEAPNAQQTSTAENLLELYNVTVDGVWERSSFLMCNKCKINKRTREEDKCNCLQRFLQDQGKSLVKMEA